MRILVCMKHVADSTEVRVDPDTGVPQLRGVPTKISDYDRHAVEAAAAAREQLSAQVTVATVGPREAIKTLKEALAMGADQAVLVTGAPAEGLDAVTTSAVLAAVADRFGPYDLILCGEASEDGYNAQVGPALAERLGIPHITYAESLTLAAGQVTAVRRAGDHMETVAAACPALVTVNRKANRPRLPTAIQVLRVQSSRIQEVRPVDLGLDEAALADAQPTRVVGYRPTPMHRKGVILDGEPAAAARQLVAHLQREGVLA